MNMPGFSADASLYRSTAHYVRIWSPHESLPGLVMPARTFGPPPPPTCTTVCSPCDNNCQRSCTITCNGVSTKRTGSCCGENFTCKNGTCVCPAPNTICATPGGSLCTNLNNDPNNCGSCGQTCIGGTCQSGKCVCPAGESMCFGTCVDLGSDPQNCGSCGTFCKAGETCCGACTNTNFDAFNCGSCGNNCWAVLGFLGANVPLCLWGICVPTPLPTL
jgi:Stigma-specific protein, Stig1